LLPQAVAAVAVEGIQRLLLMAVAVAVAALKLEHFL
jgi:hypothetical protein